MVGFASLNPPYEYRRRRLTPILSRTAGRGSAASVPREHAHRAEIVAFSPIGFVLPKWQSPSSSAKAGDPVLAGLSCCHCEACEARRSNLGHARGM